MSRNESIARELEKLQRKFTESLKTYRSELQELYLLASEAPSVENLSSLKALVHKLAGSGATFGFPEISRRAFRLETFADTLSRWILGSNEFVETSVSDDKQGEICSKGELQSELRNLYENLQNSLLVASQYESTESKRVQESQDFPAQQSLRPKSESLGVFTETFPKVLVVSQTSHLAQLVLELSNTNICTVQTVASITEAEVYLTHTLVDLIIVDFEKLGTEKPGKEELKRIENIISTKSAYLGKNFETFFVLVTDLNQLSLHSRLQLAGAGVTHFVAPNQNTEQLQAIVSQAFHSPKQEGYRVLIVDDDEQLCEYYHLMLSEKGLCVKTVSTVTKLLNILEDFRPELIVLDVHLGEISGLDIATIVRQEFHYEFTPIVFLSTDNTAVRKHIARNKGADDYLIKPLDSEELFASLLPRLKAARKHSDLAENLRRTVREREEATRRAQAAKNNMANFLATMTHEIRTPLNGVLGMAQLLFKTELNSQQTEYLQLLLRAGENLTNLITNVLDYSKMEAGKLELDLRPQSLKILTEDLKVVFSESARRAQVILLFATDPRLTGTLVFDKARLLQVATNLVANAIKFAKGGVVLFAQSLCAKKTDQPNKEVEAVLFEVVDSGIGMTELQLANLFVPFLQVHAHDREQFGGTGLGLSISQNLVKMMGSEIKATAQKGIGSHFCFEVELKRAAHNSDLSHQVNSRLTRSNVNRTKAQRFQVSSTLPQNVREIMLRFIEISQLNSETEGNADAQMYQAGITTLTTLNDSHVTDSQNVLQLQYGLYTFEDLLSEGAAEAVKGGKSTETKSQVRAQMTSVKASRQGPQPFVGIKVLVAEDQEVNQIFITALLENLGCEVALADNGQVALEQLEMEKPDVVFLDCEMPVLDGYRTAQAMRKNFPELPIFALTANSHWDERARCLASGMNEMISKPIREGDIASILKEVKGKSVANKGKHSEFDELPLLNLEQVGTLVNIAESERRTLLTTMLEAWKTVTEDFKATTNHSLLSNDFETLKRAAHRLKGAAGNIGASRLYTICDKLQESATENNIHKCTDLVKKALVALEASQTELELHDQKNAKIG